MVKDGEACTGWINVFVKVGEGGIDVLVFTIVGVTVLVAVDVSVEVEVVVAVGGSIGTVWKSNPPQTTCGGINTNKNKMPMIKKSLKVNCFFILLSYINLLNRLWNEHGRVTKVNICLKIIYNGVIFREIFPFLMID
jgi:hypothetical protein